ncbi:hypothetical protein ASD08_34475 [Streptomyces sp. Root369]|nr:hypothetical protein ASD08_34475 [Streptomyces sp. Root369]
MAGVVQRVRGERQLLCALELVHGGRAAARVPWTWWLTTLIQLPSALHLMCSSLPSTVTA